MSDLKLALVFEGIDKVSSPAKTIGSAITGTGKAAQAASRASAPLGKLTGEVGHLGINLSSLGGAAKGLDGVLGSLKAITAQVKEIAGAGLQRVGGAISRAGAALPKPQPGGQGLIGQAGGIAAAVGGGVAVKQIIDENEAFNRLRIDKGLPVDKIDELRHKLSETAITARVSKEELVAAFKGLSDAGEPIDLIEENLGVLATTIQRFGGHGEEIGQLAGQLFKIEGIKGPDALIQSLATVKTQMRGVAGGFETFTSDSGELLSLYKSLGHTGADAVSQIGAVLATASLGAKSSKEAFGDVKGLLELLQNPVRSEKAIQLQGLGVSVFGHNEEETNANLAANKTLPITDIIRDIVAKSAGNDGLASAIQAAVPELFDSLKVAIGEAKEVAPGGTAPRGFSPTLDAKIDAKGDPAKFLKEADEAGRGLKGSLNALDGTLKEIAEDALSTPFQWLADGLSKYIGVASVGIGVIGGLTVLGTVGNIARSVGGGLVKLGVDTAWAGGKMLSLGRAGFALLPSLSGIATGVAAGAESIAGMVSFSPALAGMFTAMSEGFLSVGLAIEATPIGWIITGIVAIAAAAFLIYENWGPIKAWMSELWTGIGEIFGGAWDFIVGLVTGDSERAIGGIQQVWTGLQDFFGTLFGGILGIAVLPIALIVEHWTGFKAWFSALFTDIANILGSFGEFVAAFVSGDMTKSVAALTGMWTGFQDLLSHLWDGVVETAQAVFAKIASVADILPDWITGKKTDATEIAVKVKELPSPVLADESVKSPAGVVRSSVPAVPAPVTRGLIQSPIAQTEAVTSPLPTEAVPSVQPAAPKSIAQQWVSAETRQTSVPTVQSPAIKSIAEAGSPLQGKGNLGETRGERNNNPLNLTFVPGQRGLNPNDQTDGRFGRFVTPEDGIAAAERQFLKYQDRDGLQSISALIGKWTPAGEAGNHTSAEIARLSSSLGVAPDAPVNLHDPAFAALFTHAVAKEETGKDLDLGQFQRGVNLALGDVASPKTPHGVNLGGAIEPIPAARVSVPTVPTLVRTAFAQPDGASSSPAIVPSVATGANLPTPGTALGDADPQKSLAGIAQPIPAARVSVPTVPTLERTAFAQPDGASSSPSIFPALATGANLPTLGPALGEDAPTAFGARGVTGQGKGQGGNDKGEILVRFEDAPKGTRVDLKKEPADRKISLDVGYAFA